MNQSNPLSKVSVGNWIVLGTFVVSFVIGVYVFEARAGARMDQQDYRLGKLEEAVSALVASDLEEQKAIVRIETLLGEMNGNH